LTQAGVTLGHQDVGVYAHVEYDGGAPEAFQKTPSVMIVPENLLPVVASAGDVIESVGVQDSQWSRHRHLV